ncbi:MAG TPA: hypothetical protein PLA65_16645 [Spirochaetota bacterium]|nr:hypothetical protein [Spirochaetota bacterium]HPN13688.1 hypothetical protein [Spirochaetota bacterium]
MLKPNNILTVIIMAIMMAGVSSSPEAAPRKQKTAATGKTVQGPAPVPGKRVLSDFASAYSSPSGLKTLKTYYIGIARNAVEKRGDNSVPVQFHTVGVSGRLTDCGLIMKNIYEARYYRLETEWVFQDIALKSSAPAGKPTAKLPPLDDDTAKKLIADGAGSQYGVTVQEVTLLGKKGSWKLCVPTYQVTARVMVVSKNDIQNTVAFYECLMRSTIAQEKGTWTFVTAGCVYRGKDVADCHIGTMCRTMTQESTIPPISDSEALPVLRKALEAEYGLRKNNITIEKFSLVSRFPSETFGTSITCVMSTVFVIDEFRESPAGNGIRTAEKVRAVYECSVYGKLRYSLRESKWEGIITSCCAPGSSDCGTSCSSPYKGCRRLGEK